MANLPISGLAPGTAISGTDLFPDVQTPGVGPVKVTASQIKYYTSLAPTLLNPIVLTTVTIGASGSAQGSIVLANTNPGNYDVTIKSSNSSTADWTLTLPVNAGTAGYSLLTNGSGVTSWAIPTTTNITGGAASQILYQTSGTTTGFIPNGTAAQVLLSNGSAAPSWGALDLSSSLACTNVLPVVRGGTGMSTVGTVGQALVSDGTNIVYGDPLRSFNVIGGIANEVLYQTAPNTTSFVLPGLPNQSLIVSGSGAPGWDAVDLSSSSAVKNTLPISNGGTGLTSVGSVGQSLISNGTGLAFGNPYADRSNNIAGGAASQLVYQTAPNTTNFIANGLPGQVLTSNGTIAPSWQAPPATSYNIGVNVNGTIASILASNTINDAIGNYYTFVNNTSSAITVTGAIDNYNAFPLNATSTAITIQPNSSVSFATVVRNSEYIITNASPPILQGTFNVSSSVTLVAATSVDRYGTLNINCTGVSQPIVTLPNPTNTAAGKTINIVNSGTNSFSLRATITTLSVGVFQTVTAYWNGTYWYLSASPIQSYQTNYSGAATASIPSIIVNNIGVSDRPGNTYAISNNRGGTLTLSAISIVNPSNFNFYATGTSIIVPQGAQVVVRTIIANGTYYIESMSTNVNSASAPYFYGYVFNDTTYTTGPADRAVSWQTAAASPTINYSAGVFTFPIAGLYHFDYRTVIYSAGGGGGDQINIQLQTSAVSPQPIYQQLGLGTGNYTMNLSQTIYIPANGTVTATWYANGSTTTLRKNVSQISVSRISG